MTETWVEREQRRQAFTDKLYSYAVGLVNELGYEDEAQFRSFMMAGAQRLLQSVETSLGGDIMREDFRRDIQHRKEQG